ncbi:hypothetical protein [Mycobacterium sp. Marseille-P9652]|uniref:hypothetical protein n=1 Tax=Mycobacterium sp. Marseille-P9652 TaxID=2654950 RepID=UPI0012E81DC9|nr:hypothetical protein [Mycobacterium sp. Marseille-P9652]
MKSPRALGRILGASLISGGVAAAALGLAAPAEAGASYWHYCPGQKWQYTVPIPPGFDLSVCHWFAVTAESTPSGPVYHFREADPAEVPAPSPGFPWP